MKLNSWSDAIRRTIELHRMARRDGALLYSEASMREKPPDWYFPCPLCEYLRQRDGKRDCKKCLWVEYTREKCIGNKEFNYFKKKESINRLTDWLAKEKK